MFFMIKQQGAHKSSVNLRITGVYEAICLIALEFDLKECEIISV